MNSQDWLNKARYGMIGGLVLLLLGMILFVFTNPGEKVEKIGVFLMTFGGVLLGMGYTAYATGKNNSN